MDDTPDFISRVSSYINTKLNGDQCPNATSLGECPATYLTFIYPSDGRSCFYSHVYLWTAGQHLKPSEIATWFKEADCHEITISQHMVDEGNMITDGRCQDGAISLLVEFHDRPYKPADKASPASVAIASHPLSSDRIDDIYRSLPARHDGQFSLQLFARKVWDEAATHTVQTSAHTTQDRQMGKVVAWRWSNRLGEAVTSWIEFEPANKQSIEEQVRNEGGTIEYAYNAPPVQQNEAVAQW
ncbi:MAG: hypothetical protein EPO09_02235, partial [Aquabacterium sp.]|uniref:hypothetical protein n=1 Tax=Aquabacterium sp. TaxID=1872578 RepID=UPI0012291A97